MGPSFSDTDDEILVEEVANNPSLWQLSHVLYKDQRVKDNTWGYIAQKVGQPIHLCKKRWRNIKDTYDRKQNKKSFSAVTPTRKGKKWVLEEKLLFLRTAEGRRGSFTNLNPSKEEEEYPLSDEEQMAPTLTPILTPHNTLHEDLCTTRKRKITNIRETLADNLGRNECERNTEMPLLVEETEDDIDLFFKSLAKSVKRLRPSLQQQAKIETLNIITKLEIEMWGQQ